MLNGGQISQPIQNTPNENANHVHTQNAEFQTAINGIWNSINSNNYNLEQTLLLSSLFTPREQYIRGASICDSKDPSAFKNWRDVCRLSTLSGKTCNEVASAPSNGPLH